MRFTNASGCEAGWTLGFERDGRELLVVIVKATYDLPSDGEPATFAARQQPLVQADVFSGEPGLSAPLFESDYAHRKPCCDVLLLGRAHAPGGREVRRLPVGLQVGPMCKRFLVTGHRSWGAGLLGVSAGEPQPFSTMPISYDCAFGGTDRTREASDGRVETYLENPVGRGHGLHKEAIDGQPLPNTEQIGEPVTSPRGRYRPAAFSPIGRWWRPRCDWAGSYDQRWLDETAPFWPDDFQWRYFQAAPPDQVVEGLRGDEPVLLEHLTPDGRRAFRLPGRQVSATFVPHVGKDVRVPAMLDTVVLEPDEGRFTLTWRASLALGRSVFDVKEAIAGEMSGAWHRARRFPGKRYFRGLGEAVATLQQEKA
jgi:hypothetical protein